jgi:hypothetical protein
MRDARVSQFHYVLACPVNTTSVMAQARSTPLESSLFCFPNETHSSITPSVTDPLDGGCQHGCDHDGQHLSAAFGP